MKIGYLFSAQGHQFPGMGQDLFTQEPLYRQTIKDISEILNQDFSKTEVMDNPQNTAVSIVTFSLGIERILANEFKNPAVELGLSLGEYSALITAEAMELQTGMQVVQDRARYMEEAARINPGKMIAVMKASSDQIKSVCERTGAFPANFNTPVQTVLGGTDQSVMQATKFLKDEGIKRIVPLKVDAASHTPLMEHASELLERRLAEVEVTSPTVPVISNTTTQPFDEQTLKQVLVEQLVEPTRFSTCLKEISDKRVNTFVEIGPGKALTGFVKKTLSGVGAYHIDSVETLNEVRHALSQGGLEYDR